MNVIKLFFDVVFFSSRLDIQDNVDSDKKFTDNFFDNHRMWF